MMRFTSALRHLVFSRRYCNFYFKLVLYFAKSNWVPHGTRIPPLWKTLKIKPYLSPMPPTHLQDCFRRVHSRVSPDELPNLIRFRERAPPSKHDESRTRRQTRVGRGQRREVNQYTRQCKSVGGMKVGRKRLNARERRGGRGGTTQGDDGHGCGSRNFSRQTENRSSLRILSTSISNPSLTCQSRPGFELVRPNTHTPTFLAYLPSLTTLLCVP